MKKVFKKAALAALGLSLVAGSAQAVSLDVYSMVDTSAPGPFLANEANDQGVLTPAPFGPFDIDASAANTQGFIMVTIGNNSPTQVVLEITDGEFLAATAGDSYYLYPWDDGNADGILTTLELGIAVEGSTGLPAVGNLAGGVLTFVGPLAHADGGLLAAGSRLVLAASPTGTVADGADLEEINWQLDADTDLDSSVTLTVTESGAFADDATDTATIGQFMNEYTLCAPADVFDGIIDIDPVGGEDPKTVFTIAGGAGPSIEEDDGTYVLFDRNQIDTSVAADGCGDSIDYAASYMLIQAANGGAVADIEGVLTTTADNQALELALDDSMKATIGVGASADAPFVDGTGFVTATGETNADGGGRTTTFLMDAFVDGSTIDTRTFGFSVVSTPAAGFPVMTYTLPTGTGAGAWTLGEGYDGIITYFPIGYAGYNAFIKVTNHFNEAGEINLDAKCETADGTQVAANGDLADVGPESHVTYSTADVVAALGLTVGDTYQCAVEIVANVPGSLFQASGIQIGPDGRTALPLYNVADNNLVQ